MPYFREALEMFRAVLPPESQQMEFALNNLGAAMDGAGMSDQTEPIWREVVQRRTARLPDNDYRLANVRSRLGNSLTMLGRFAEAEALLLAAYDILKADPETIREPGENWEIWACERIVRLYQKWNQAQPSEGRAAQVKKWEGELAALLESTK